MQNISKRKKNNFLNIVFNGSAINLLIFFNVLLSIFGFALIYLMCGDVQQCNVLNYFSLNPNNFFQGKYLWTIFTHMFFHGSLPHLFINMFVLFSLGGLCERIIGQKRFVWFYLVAGLFAGLLSVFFSSFFGYGIGERIFGSPEVYMVGASGAIFGIAGLFVVLLPRLRFSIIFFPFFSLPAYIMIPLILFLTWIASYFADLPIGNMAHFGGFLAGIVYGYYLKNKYKKKVQVIQGYFR